MKRKALLWSALFGIAALVGFAIAWLLGNGPRNHAGGDFAAADRGAIEITLAATIDGSERFIFTRDNAWDDHGRWQPPKDVLFNGEPWTDLSQSPDGWPALAETLELTKARLVLRNGRDTIALETTADGFDLYFADTQMGSAKYLVTISIPRK